MFRWCETNPQKGTLENRPNPWPNELPHHFPQSSISTPQLSSPCRVCHGVPQHAEGSTEMLQTKGMKNSTHWCFKGECTGNHSVFPGSIEGSSQFSHHPIRPGSSSWEPKKIRRTAAVQWQPTAPLPLCCTSGNQAGTSEFVRCFSQRTKSPFSSCFSQPRLSILLPPDKFRNSQSTTTLAGPLTSSDIRHLKLQSSTLDAASAAFLLCLCSKHPDPISWGESHLPRNW